MRQSLPLLIACTIFIACSQSDQTMKTIDNTTITGFELEKYLGTWYEIARFPHRFEKNLQGVTATYSMRKNGMVEVKNAGYEGSLDGKLKSATGKAKLAGNPDIGHLKVSFFLFFYADYFIMDMDRKNYQWALVGSSSPNYLWILSRTPEMDSALFESITKTATERGYDLSRLQLVKQIAK